MTTAKTRELQLPGSLEAERGDLARALETPVPAGEWPPDEVYRVAAQPAAIGAVLVEALHVELAGARIAYLFRERIKSKGREIGGKASKAGAKLAMLAGVDFVIDFNWWAWRGLTPEQRLALVDHELEHCSEDAEKETWTLVPHDVEEFLTIYNRWGAWTSTLRAWASVNPQLELELNAGPRAVP